MLTGSAMVASSLDASLISSIRYNHRKGNRKIPPVFLQKRESAACGGCMASRGFLHGGAAIPRSDRCGGQADRQREQGAGDYCQLQIVADEDFSRVLGGLKQQGLIERTASGSCAGVTVAA
ncbi:hypothetical protein [Sphingobium indicum]|uniref:hypothetical protein n=1 Tax=Sphingobium indicum TaxID=332055 RepID=UPI0012DC6E09|nr:hypothetical protein [Sphingobium indicum]